jgi:diguanylate cyclase (GGDEF)-like protein/PAS domain S-box-containing protein
LPIVEASQQVSLVNQMAEKNFKGLRTKILTILAVGMFSLFALLFFVARTVMLQGYSKLESDKTLVQVNSAVSMLNEQSRQIKSIVGDYAHWDDTYEYAAKPSRRYIEANYTEESLTNIKVNAVVVVDNDGKAIYKQGFDYVNKQPWVIPKLLEVAMKKGGTLLDPSRDEITGIFWTPEAICFVSARSIMDSHSSQPRRGTLIMVRYLDSALTHNIEKIVGAKLSIQPITSAKLLEDRQNLTLGYQFVKPISKNEVTGYYVVDDVGGDAHVLVGASGDRKIFGLANASLRFLYGSLLFIAFALLSFSLMLDKLVLSRLANLSRNVRRVGESSTDKRVQALSGDDELAGLSHAINHMLGRLDESQLALTIEKERVQVTLAGIADAVITSDVAGHVLYMNIMAERLTGVSADDAKGKSLQTLFHLMNEDKTLPVASNWLIDPASGFDEVVLERNDGVSFIITKSTSPLRNDNGMLFGHVTVLHDVTMLRSLSNQLSYQARHDALTGLINRYEFDRKTQEAIDDAASGSRIHCIAYIDLDQFKVVNDTCGHAAGDQLLRQLADHLKAKVRSADTLARLGGDEFALLLMGCDLQKAQSILDEMLEIVREYRFTYDDKVFKVGASIGVTEISPSQNLTLSEIVSTADSACYAAKQNGGNRVYAHRLNDDDMLERNNQLEWVSRIHLALEQQQFVLYIQRIESLGLSLEKHCELLIRMRGEDGTLYPPGFFLPAAERYHLMPGVDRWVVAEALKIMARKGDDFPYVCAINLSGQTLTEEGFLDYVISQIKLNGVDAKRICFEITETAVIANLNKARQFIHALRAIGCRFSLDDFGSGLSSFAYLKNLEVDFLKIDGMFVKNIVNNKIDRAMVESINNVGHVMGLHTIAEFVENNEIISELKKIGVDYAQGYGVAKPELFE